jgi:hypothetical protein
MLRRSAHLWGPIGGYFFLLFLSQLLAVDSNATLDEGEEKEQQAKKDDAFHVELPMTDGQRKAMGTIVAKIRDLHAKLQVRWRIARRRFWLLLFVTYMFL